MKNILNIIKDSNYNFSLFDQKLIDELENKIFFKDDKPYVEAMHSLHFLLVEPHIHPNVHH